MALNYQIEDIAQEIWTADLDEPSDVTVGAIKFWLRGAVGRLNNLLGTDYTLNDSGNEISPLLGFDEIAILKSLYIINYYNRLIRNNLGASAFSAVTELTSDGGRVRMISKTELAKNYLQMAKDEKDFLMTLIKNYKMKNGLPKQIVGADVLELANLDPDSPFSRYTR